VFSTIKQHGLESLNILNIYKLRKRQYINIIKVDYNVIINSFILTSNWLKFNFQTSNTMCTLKTGNEIIIHFCVSLINNSNFYPIYGLLNFVFFFCRRYKKTNINIGINNCSITKTSFETKLIIPIILKSNSYCFF